MEIFHSVIFTCRSNSQKVCNAVYVFP